MSFLTKSTYLIPKLVGFKLAYFGLIKAPTPINLTFSVTHACQSLCKTCNIGAEHRKHPERVKQELNLEQIEQMFKDIGKVYFFNISGGEPFLRKDLPEIIELAIKYLNPAIIHTPTNALLPEVIEKQTKKIMEIVKDRPFTIKPSFDAVGKKHDKIRGAKGNWEKLLETLKRLKKLKQTYPNLHVGVGTVISNYSIKDLEETMEFVRSLQLDSYISEIAEEREEMYNTNKITPSAESYEKAIKNFKEETRNQLKNSRSLARIQMNLRLIYYDIAVKILKQKKQVLPCYAGISNVHINAYGDVWPCCILAYSKSMGNVKEKSFKEIWNSKKAKEVRKYIRDRNCYCPLANQAYSNILLNPLRALIG